MDDINQYIEKINLYYGKVPFNEFIDQTKKIIMDAPKQFHDELYEQLADIILDSFVYGGIHYPDDIAHLPIFNEYSNIVSMLKTDEPLTDIYRAIHLLLSGRNEQALVKIQSWFNAKLKQYSEEGKIFNCNDFTSALALTLKKGYPGLWTSIGKLLEREGVEKGLSNLCNALEKIYYSEDINEVINALSLVLIENNDIYLAKELLGYTYYTIGMWSNAIAYFEQLEDYKDIYHMFYPDMIYFYMAWCYGKIKDYKNEEMYYRKAYDLYPEAEYVLNNLGYSLYKQKRYHEAKDIFKKCIELQRDTKYALNNLAMTLVALNEKKEALELIKTYPTISKRLKDRIKNLSSVNQIKIVEEEENVSEKPSRISSELGVKKHQFSSERILEDEIIMRLESGVNVFGLPLKIYKKHGKYGRQYIIPVGRIDILAIDQEENLYVIELKKDSGYSDAYDQTVKYIEWLSDNEVRKGRRVYGIICLNDPSKDLIYKVRQDRRVKLYEYSISYREIK